MTKKGPQKKKSMGARHNIKIVNNRNVNKQKKE